MTSLRELSAKAQSLGYPGTQWRDDLLPARFRQALFHVETGSKQNGRRIVVHQFPKREAPYSEDMGREAKAFAVRGYTICFPFNTDVALYQRDYRVARDRLITELETGGPGALQLPTFPNAPILVVCPRYSVAEETKFGGFAVFDMQFVELGAAPSEGMWQIDPTAKLIQESSALRDQVKAALAAPFPRRAR